MITKFKKEINPLYVLAICAVVFIALMFWHGRVKCEERAEWYGLEYKYSYVTGCFMRVKGINRDD